MQKHLNYIMEVNGYLFLHRIGLDVENNLYFWFPTPTQFLCVVAGDKISFPPSHVNKITFSFVCSATEKGSLVSLAFIPQLRAAASRPHI